MYIHVYFLLATHELLNDFVHYSVFFNSCLLDPTGNQEEMRQVDSMFNLQAKSDASCAK